MVHKKEFSAGEISIHYMPTSISGVIRLSGKGNKGNEVYLMAGGLRCQNGQLDPQDAIDYFIQLKKELEESKHGHKR